MSRGINPWHVLRERQHIVFDLHRLPDGVGGVYWPCQDRAVILIDDRLSQVDRRAALLHELVHDERGGGVEGQWTAKDEDQVNREVAHRLVPMVMLARFIDRVVDLGEPVHAASVAEEFDVPLDVAQRALWLLDQARRAG